MWVDAPRPPFHGDLLEVLRSHATDSLFDGVDLSAVVNDVQGIVGDRVGVRDELGLSVNEAAALSLCPGENNAFATP